MLEPGEIFRPIFMIGKCRIAKKTEPVPFSPFAPLISTQPAISEDGPQSESPNFKSPNFRGVDIG